MHPIRPEATSRAKPEHESGRGELGSDKDAAAPVRRPDKFDQTAGNRQGARQINADDGTNQRSRGNPRQPDHSMHEEQPLGWDQAPVEAKKPREKRQPRTQGKGGTP